MRFLRDTVGRAIPTDQIKSAREVEAPGSHGRCVEIELIGGARAVCWGTIDDLERGASDIFPANPGWMFAVKIEDENGVAYAKMQPIVGWVTVGGVVDPVLLTGDIRLGNHKAVVSPSGYVVSVEYDREFDNVDEWLRFDPNDA